jgi:Superinfection immunity protein
VVLANQLDDLIWTWSIFVGLVGLYFLPTIVAASRKVPNVGSIAVINVFLGWTLVGWVVALAMAARTVPTRSGC